jgi:histidinol phosphatase-like enzyme
MSQSRLPRLAPSPKALFLDRDGTLIIDKHYLADPAGVEIIPGVRARAPARPAPSATSSSC